MGYTVRAVLNAFDLTDAMHTGFILARHVVFASRLNMSPTINNSHFRQVTPGIETLPCSFSLPWHRHLRAYATVVLAGSYEESGHVGRIQATAGDVLIHTALDCHANR